MYKQNYNGYNCNKTVERVRLNGMNYRNAELAGVAGVAEAARELVVPAGKGGVAAVDGGDGGGGVRGVCRHIVEEAVLPTRHRVLIGEVEQIVDGKRLPRLLLRREIGLVPHADVALRHLHRHVCPTDSRFSRGRNAKRIGDREEREA